eukprot:gene7903-9387_t
MASEDMHGEHRQFGLGAVEGASAAADTAAQGPVEEPGDINEEQDKYRMRAVWSESAVRRDLPEDLGEFTEDFVEGGLRADDWQLAAESGDATWAKLCRVAAKDWRRIRVWVAAVQRVEERMQEERQV